MDKYNGIMAKRIFRWFVLLLMVYPFVTTTINFLVIDHLFPEVAMTDKMNGIVLMYNFIGVSGLLWVCTIFEVLSELVLTTFLSVRYKMPYREISKALYNNEMLNLGLFKLAFMEKERILYLLEGLRMDFRLPK